jgi:MinD-like ATPase involved in chromosome partitioning or flagellar assembly
VFLTGERDARTGSDDDTPKKSKRRTRKRTPASDKVVPTQGLPGIGARVALGLNQPKLVPGLSKKEQLQLQWEQSKRSLIDLIGQVPRHSVCFINPNGFAATTTTVAYTVSLFGELTRTMVVGMDFNPASDTLGPKLGFDEGTTIDLRQLFDQAEELLQFTKFIAHARPNRNSVRVVSGSFTVEKDRKIDAAEAREILRVVNANREYYFADTASDATSPVSLAIIDDCDTLVFTANAAVPDSLRKIAYTMETLRGHGFEEKVNNAVVVISNIPKGKTLDDYRKYLSKVSTTGKVTCNLERSFNGQLHGILHDPAITQNDVVDLDSLQFETSQAYLDLLVGIFEQAPQLIRSKRSSVGSIVKQA